MRFTYQARDATGRVREAEVTAANREEATRQLRQEGLYLLSLNEAASAPAETPLAAGGFQEMVALPPDMTFTCVPRGAEGTPGFADTELDAVEPAEFLAVTTTL